MGWPFICAKDLRFSLPASDVDGSAALPFVIPTEAEGSAVPRTSPGNFFQQCGGICDVLHPSKSAPQHPFLHFAKIADCNRSRSPGGNS